MTYEPECMQVTMHAPRVVSIWKVRSKEGRKEGGEGSNCLSVCNISILENSCPCRPMLPSFEIALEDNDEHAAIFATETTVLDTDQEHSEVPDTEIIGSVDTVQVDFDANAVIFVAKETTVPDTDDPNQDEHSEVDDGSVEHEESNL